MFSESARIAQKLEVCTSNASMTQGKLNHRDNMGSGHPWKTGFICDKVPG